MRSVSIPKLTIPVFLVAALAACSSAQHQNVTHPTFGEAQYRSDLADCRKQNSTYTSHQGYDVQVEVKTDESKVDACMTERGWQTVSR
jgi:hypothetical protein